VVTIYHGLPRDLLRFNPTASKYLNPAEAITAYHDFTFLKGWAKMANNAIVLKIAQCDSQLADVLSELPRLELSALYGDVSRGMISRLTKCGLTANECDRDMAHRRIGLGAMPMPFAGLDMHDITHINLTMFVFRRHHPGA
jgi:hypothetical protein